MNLLSIIKEEYYPASGGDYENYVMAYDNEASLMASMRIARKNGLHLFHGFEEGGFNGGTYVLYKDEDKLPLYIKEAVQAERIGWRIKDAFNYFAPSLSLVKYKENYYVVDGHYLGRADMEYGVMGFFTEKEDLKSISIDAIPEAYIDNEIDFLLHRDLKIHYKLNGDLVKKFGQTPFCYWSYLARENGYDKLWHDLEKPCRFVEGVKISLSDSEIRDIPEAEGAVKKTLESFLEKAREDGLSDYLEDER